MRPTNEMMKNTFELLLLVEYKEMSDQDAVAYDKQRQ